MCSECMRPGRASCFCCCGKCIFHQCKQTNKVEQCPLCRAEFPRADQALDAMQKHRDNGHSWATCGLAVVCERGDHGVVVDKQKALELCRCSADEGHACFMCRLGALCLFEEEGVLTESYPDAHRWLKAAADKGHNEAQASPGIAHYDGDEGVAIDKAEAVHLFTLSMSQDLDTEKTAALLLLPCLVSVSCMVRVVWGCLLRWQSFICLRWH